MKTMVYTIENDEDLKEATAYASSLMDAKTSAEGAALRLQAQIIMEYEDRTRPPIAPVTVPELLEYLMEEHDVTPAEMAQLLGARSRVSEIMNGHKVLNLAAMERLSARFHLPLEIFADANKTVAPEPRPLKRGRPLKRAKPSRAVVV